MTLLSRATALLSIGSLLLASCGGGGGGSSGGSSSGGSSSGGTVWNVTGRSQRSIAVPPTEVVGLVVAG